MPVIKGALGQTFEPHGPARSVVCRAVCIFRSQVGLSIRKETYLRKALGCW